MFRRRRDRSREGPPAGEEAEYEPQHGDEDEADYDEEPAEQAAEADGGASRPEAPPAQEGPWDESDAPDDGLPLIELGALRVPAPPGVEVRLEVEQASQQPVAVTLAAGASQLQIAAFAAPKSAGIWDDVRAEIAGSVRQSGGTASEAPGRFGVALTAQAVVDAPGKGRALQPLRFIGVDGPRWFLRGLLSGPAASDPAAARALEDAFAGVVVVRGTEARAPREPLPLVLPRELQEAMGIEPAAQGRHVIEVFARGPEITETR